MNYDLMMIKEKYGEKMMHLCRKLFPTILETEGLLFKHLSDNFAYSKYLYEDIVSNMMEGRFSNYIYSLIKKDEEEILLDTGKTPEELLSDAGYDLYECKTEEEIQSFMKYYHSKEFLCTFKGDRLNTCYVFFAVRKNVSEIKREDFMNPMRQDVYGTSVISIQFTKGDVNTLSIKNRYNHTVNNPDATFSNNLENIVPGLTRSFEKIYGFNINQNEFGTFEIPGYVKANDGKFYKYNYEINNKYYCPDNIIIDNFEVVDKYSEKEKYIIVDYFIVDLMEKKIYLYDDSIYDSFTWSLRNIKNIHISKDKNTKSRSFLITYVDNTNAVIEIDKYNRIISYVNENITRIDDNFLFRNKYLKNIEIPKVLEIGSNFLCRNVALTDIELLNVLRIGDDFLSDNKIITNINVPSLMHVGDNFLMSNEGIEKLDLPNLEYVRDSFLEHNRNLKEINALKLKSVASKFLYYNLDLKSINFPCLEYCEDHFITANNAIENINLPNLVQVGDNFLWRNKNIRILDMPKLANTGRNFLYANSIIDSVNLPMLWFVGNSFLYGNESLEYLNLPLISFVGSNFMFNNNKLTSLFMPYLREVGNDFLRCNCKLSEFDLSSLKDYGRNFLYVHPGARKKILSKSM